MFLRMKRRQFHREVRKEEAKKDNDKKWKRKKKNRGKSNDDTIKNLV